jgi:hypothetical protein
VMPYVGQGCLDDGRFRDGSGSWDCARHDDGM